MKIPFVKYFVWSIMIVAITYLAYAWYHSRNIEMSQRPSMEASESILEPRASVIVANMYVTYPVIQKALNGVSDKLSGSKNGAEEIKCISNDIPRIRECLTVNWDVTYSRAGDISVGRSGNMLQVAMPAQFSGGAGFGGEVARILSLSRKTFSGSFIVSVTAALNVDEHFCPVLAPGTASFEWRTPARVEIIGHNSFRILGIGFDVGPWHLDVGSHFTGKIQDQIRTALQQASRAIPCDPVRTELAKLWRDYAFPLAIKNLSPLFVNVQPTELSTSGLLAEDQGMRIIARMAAKTVISPDHGKEDSRELPRNNNVAAEHSKLALVVPLKASYDILRTEALKAIGTKTFSRQIESGEIHLKVIDIEIYPVGDKLALGIRFSAGLPWRVFNVTGIVWLTAKPTVDASGKIVTLEGIESTRQLDNEIWNVVSILLKDTINAELNKAARYDLTPLVTNTIAAIQTTISEQSKSDGIIFSLIDPDIHLGGVTAEKLGLSIEGIFESKWDAAFKEIKL